MLAAKDGYCFWSCVAYSKLTPLEQEQVMQVPRNEMNVPIFKYGVNAGKVNQRTQKIEMEAARAAMTECSSSLQQSGNFELAAKVVSGDWKELEGFAAIDAIAHACQLYVIITDEHDSMQLFGSALDPPLVLMQTRSVEGAEHFDLILPGPEHRQVLLQHAADLLALRVPAATAVADDGLCTAVIMEVENDEVFADREGGGSSGNFEEQKQDVLYILTRVKHICFF